MRTLNVLVSFAALTLVACSHRAPSAPAREPAAALPADAKSFGASLSGNPPLGLAAVLTAPDSFCGKTVVVDGSVRATCTRKGCWMELAPSTDKDAPGCRVTFKDYGFFVPLNSQGSDARVEGQVSVKAIPATEVAHLKSEGGRFPGQAARRQRARGSHRGQRSGAVARQLTCRIRWCMAARRP